MSLRQVADGDRLEGRIYLIFESAPGPEGAVFIEAEDAAGRSVAAGEWVELQDGRAALVLKPKDVDIMVMPTEAGWYLAEDGKTLVEVLSADAYRIPGHPAYNARHYRHLAPFTRLVPEVGA